MAIQFAADMAPKGAQCTRAGARDALAPATASRAATRAANEDSQTVRKHSTWRHSAVADRHGARDDGASRPRGYPPPPLTQVGWIRSASSMALTPPSRNPPTAGRPGRWTTRRCRRA